MLQARSESAVRLVSSPRIPGGKVLRASGFTWNSASSSIDGAGAGAAGLALGSVFVQAPGEAVVEREKQLLAVLGNCKAELGPVQGHAEGADV